MVQLMATPAIKETDSYVETFERFEEQAKQPAWVFPLRKAGITRFAELGFPTLQQEDWRFTNVAPIAQLPFKPVFQVSRNSLTRGALAELTFGKLAASRLVFVNGHYAAELSSSPEPQPQGVIVSSLAAALTGNSGLVKEHLARYPQGEENPFAALNAAFFQDGGFIYVPAGQHVEAPVHLLYISTAKEAGATSHPRNLIIAEKGSQVTVLESYVSLAEASYFTNAVTEMILEEGAAVEHVKFQDESRNAYHVASIHVHLGRGSNFISHSIATGARLSRNNILTTLAGERVECILNGLYLTRGDQLADHHMVVEHAQPHCNSHEYYNGILDGHSKGVFHGRILVRRPAQKTDAKQTNKNLLLSDDATVDTKPQLEIYADDVKCTHGATIGQLNEESIFYLRARGIGAETARRMLIHAFAGEIIERIRHITAREELNQLVWERLEQNPRVGEKKGV
jgi:Fe-S cluster assembly protein SufD